MRRRPSSHPHDEASVILASNPLVLDVFRHAPNGGFRRVEIAGCIDGDPFAHGAVRSIGRVRWHEDRDLAVFQASRAYPPEPARMNPRGRLGVGHINRVVLIDGQSAPAAELRIFTDILPILGQDLDSVVVAVVHPPAPLRNQYGSTSRSQIALVPSRLSP